MTEPITPEHAAAELERRAARKLLAEYFEHGDGGHFYDRVKLFLGITTDPSATPVPAVEHQAGYGTMMMLDAAPRRYANPTEASHTDIAPHQPQAPSVRFVEPDRAAFIALYEAARDAADACRGVGKYEGRPYPALQALEGQLDKAAPAYGRALVARAEARCSHEWVFMSGAGELEVCRRCHQPKETGGQ